MTLAYLSAPYSDPDPKIKWMRHQIVNQIAVELISQGIFVFSPLTYSTPLSEFGFRGWDNWEKFDLEMVFRCDQLIVLQLPGWENSRGVAAEIAFANELGLPIEWMEVSEERIKAYLVSK